MIGNQNKSGTRQVLIEQGLHIRPAQFRDLRFVVPMLNRSSQAMFGASEFELARYHAKWRAPDLDLERDTRLVLTEEEQPVGLVEVWSMSNPAVHLNVQGRVDPGWEGRGIGWAMLTWAHRRASASAEQVPSGLRVSLRCTVPAGYKPAVRLMTSFGLSPVRSSWDMVRELDSDLAKPVWPQGITLREFRFPGDARRVSAADQAIFQDHWGFIPEEDESGYYRWRHYFFEHRHFDPSLWFLAMDADRIAGLALCRPRAALDPGMGWISVLGVMPEWRRRGLGLALLQHAFCVFRSRGLGRVGLGVDSQNLTGATHLYRKAGMRIAQEKTLYELEIRDGHELQTEHA